MEIFSLVTIFIVSSERDPKDQVQLVHLSCDDEAKCAYWKIVIFPCMIIIER